MKTEKTIWQKSREELFQELSSTPEGLTGAEAARRLEHYGPNELQEGGRKSVLRIFLEQFADFLVIILIDLLFQKIFAHNNIPLIQNFLPSNIAKHVPHLSISQNRRFFWTNAKYPRFLFVRSDKTNRELLAFVKPF